MLHIYKHLVTFKFPGYSIFSLKSMILSLVILLLYTNNAQANHWNQVYHKQNLSIHYLVPHALKFACWLSCHGNTVVFSFHTFLSMCL